MPKLKPGVALFYSVEFVALEGYFAPFRFIVEISAKPQNYPGISRITYKRRAESQI